MRAAEKLFSKQDLSKHDLAKFDLAKLDLSEMDIADLELSRDERTPAQARRGSGQSEATGQPYSRLNPAGLDSPSLMPGEHMVFEPLQLVDKLAYLACYSQYIISVKSENQNYQTHLLAEALSTVTPVCVLSGGAIDSRSSGLKQASSMEHLYQEISLEFGLNADHADDSGLHDYASSQDIRPVVIVSQAEAVSDEKLLNLFSMADRTGLGLVLFSAAGLATKKASLNMAGRILHTSVARLTTQDVRRLIRNRSNQEQQVSEAKLQEVLDNCGGYVERVDPALEGVLRVKKESLGLPMVHMSMLVLLLVVLIGGAIGGGMSLQDSGEYFVEEVAVKPKALPEPLVGNETLVATEVPASEVVTPSKANLKTVVSDEKNSNIGSSGDPQLASIEEVFIAPPILLNDADPNAWINNLPAPAAGASSVLPSSTSTPIVDAANMRANAPGVLSQSQWITEASQSAYTLQILGSSDEARIQQYMSQYANLDSFGYVETRHRGQPWFILTYGRFSSRDEAVAAIDALDAEFQALKPWARGVSSIR